MATHGLLIVIEHTLLKWPPVDFRKQSTHLRTLADQGDNFAANTYEFSAT